MIGFIYQKLLKPVLFLCDAEKVHNTFIQLGKTLGQFYLTRSLTYLVLGYRSSKEDVVINGIHFPTRIGLSAGFDYNADLTQIVPSLGFGFATVGTITYQAYEGNSRPRLGRLPKSKALLVFKA